VRFGSTVNKCIAYYLSSNIYYHHKDNSDGLDTITFSCYSSLTYIHENLSSEEKPLRVALYSDSVLRDRCQDTGFLIGVGRGQDYLRRYVAVGIGAISAGFITRFRYHSDSIVNNALLKMGPHVAALRELATAIGAGIRLGTSMIIKVSFQMMLLSESLRAQGALIGFQAGVQSSV